MSGVVHVAGPRPQGPADQWCSRCGGSLGRGPWIEGDRIVDFGRGELASLDLCELLDEPNTKRILEGAREAPPCG